MKKRILYLALFSCLYADEETTLPSPSETALETTQIDSPLPLTNSPFTNAPTSPEGLETKAPLLPKPYKNPTVAITLSSLFPGLGHVYLGQYRTAAEILGSASLGIGIAAMDPENLTVSGMVFSQNTIFYGIYAAYRDAYLYNGSPHSRYEMPLESASDLSTASFRWSILKKPEVWGSIVGLLAISEAISFFSPSAGCITYDISPEINPFAAFSIGVGEEALFRGYLQSYFSETYNPTAGIILSSVAFGLAHVGNAAQFTSQQDRLYYYCVGIPYITSVGAYFAYLTKKNRSMKESVAIHSWYDFSLFLFSSLATPSAIAQKPKFSFSCDF